LQAGETFVGNDLMRHATLVAGALLSAAGVAGAQVGFQHVSVPDPGGAPLAVGLWYPTTATASPQALGLFQQNVALDAPVAGTNLPVVFISHGTGGSLASHYDTALELARAGFVVVALTHTGDNSQDQRYAGNRVDLVDRPRQLKQVVSFVLDDWKDRSHIDANEAGVFGFSLGGFTALVGIGGVPEAGRMAQLCRERPAAPECAFIRQRHSDQLAASNQVPIWAHDSRIKAAVIAAPAASYLFGPGSLKQVSIPVQLWRAGEDTEAPDTWSSAVVLRELPAPPDVHTVQNAGHYAFLAPCSEDVFRLDIAVNDAETVGVAQRIRDFACDRHRVSDGQLPFALETRP
jgi:predicted dienelactone hydrolase